MNIKKIVIFLLAMSYYFNIYSQNFQFSQHYAFPLFLNSSYAGSTDGSRFSTIYRNQWAKFTTYGLSYDHYFNKINSGIGLVFIKDMPGNSVINNNIAIFQYSYSISINRFWEIRPSLQASYSNTNIDFSKFTFKEQIYYGNSFVQTNELYSSKVNYFDAGSGLLLYSANLWTGISVNHLLRPDISSSNNVARIPVKYTVFGGKRFDLAKSGFGLFKSQNILLSAIYKQQQKFRQLDLGFYWEYRMLSLGFWYRGIPISIQSHKSGNDALIFITGYKFKDFKISYSFDLTISKLMGYGANAHEISLSLDFFQNKSQKKKRFNKAIPNPKF